MSLIELDKMTEFFAVDIIKLTDELNEKNWESLADWVFYSGTQIGVNISKSKVSSDAKDFISEISAAFTRANETLYWLDILYDAELISRIRYEYLKYRCNRIRIEISKALRKAKETF